MQTEKAKSSHFDRTRGDKNQIFRTLVSRPFTHPRQHYHTKSTRFASSAHDVVSTNTIFEINPPLARKNPLIHSTRHS